MKIRSKFKKLGFSLMELALAVLIVAVLALITIPVIGRQLEKSDEFAYYMAYKTVEKMSGQIVALGDPAESAADKEDSFKDYFIAKIDSTKNDIKDLFATIGNKFAYSEKYMFSKLFPNTIASDSYTVTKTLHEWWSIDYDDIWQGYRTCLAAEESNMGDRMKKAIPVIVKTYALFDFDDKKTEYEYDYLKPSDFNYCFGYTRSGSLYKCERGKSNAYMDEDKFPKGKGLITQVAAGNGNLSVDYSGSGDFSYTKSDDQSGNSVPLKVTSPYLADVCIKTDSVENKENSIFTDLVCDSDLCKEIFKDQIDSWISKIKTDTNPKADEMCNAYWGYSGKKIDGYDAQIKVMFNHSYSAQTDGFLYAPAGGGSTVTWSTPSSMGTTNHIIVAVISQNNEISTTNGRADVAIPVIYPSSPNFFTDGYPINSPCVVAAQYNVNLSDASTLDIAVSARPEFAENWCTESGGWYGGNSDGTRNDNAVKNEAAPGAVDCQCQLGYQQTVNNDRVCYPKPPRGKNLYDSFIKGVHKPVYCKGDFSDADQDCCETLKGKHSMYNGTACVCTAGWTEGTSGKCDKQGPCPKGTSKAEDGTCVANPPIVSAKRFCELVVSNWNVNSSACNVFTAANDANVYTNVYNAALGNDSKTTYLSISSKPGAFKEIDPNIVFANGLKMWILGDKAASIPGLSFWTDNADKSISNTQNMCIKVPIASANADACSAATPAGSSYKNWFCRADKNCFRLTNESYPPIESSEPGTALREARNCCSTSDISDLHAASAKLGTGHENDYKQDPTVYAIGGFTVFVDINGDKGEGTLWHDVFPFYISANGTVYPAYPLNATKSKVDASGNETGNSLYLGGNSDKQLPVDVYYYLPAAGEKVRVRKLAFSNVSYARGVCSARKVSKFTPYCMNLGQKFSGKGTDGNPLPDNYISIDDDTSKNPCDKYNCYVSVKKKLRFF